VKLPSAIAGGNFYEDKLFVENADGCQLSTDNCQLIKIHEQ